MTHYSFSLVTGNRQYVHSQDLNNTVALAMQAILLRRQFEICLGQIFFPSESIQALQGNEKGLVVCGISSPASEFFYNMPQMIYLYETNFTDV